MRNFKTFGNLIHKIFKINIFWDWWDFGLVLKFNKQNNIGSYYFSLDIQILWLNFWIQCWGKPNK